MDLEHKILVDSLICLQVFEIDQFLSEDEQVAGCYFKFRMCYYLRCEKFSEKIKIILYVYSDKLLAAAPEHYLLKKEFVQICHFKNFLYQLQVYC